MLYLVLPVAALVGFVALAGSLIDEDGPPDLAAATETTAVATSATLTTSPSTTLSTASPMTLPTTSTSVVATTTAPVATDGLGPLPGAGPSGEFTAASLPGLTFGAAPFMQFSVAVEEGLGVDPDALADFVDETLADERSWIGDGRRGFERIAEGGTFTLVIAHPDTVDGLCVPLTTNGNYSCARNGWVAINSDRWAGATDFWSAGLEEYRRYVVNHEIGHYLGELHTPCPGVGELAPIMQQQTIRLDGCEGNGWPFPEDS